MSYTTTLGWGIDLGGTKIECAVYDFDQQKILLRQRLPTEAFKGYDHILHQIQTLINQVAASIGHRPKAVGFSTPGTLDPATQTMKNCNTTAMNGRPMHLDLENILQVPVRLANDANCFALAEATQGAAAHLNAEVVFGVILGTGVGGGLVVHNQLITGRHGIGGEWGHILFDPEGPPCYCGKRGCNEMIFSGPKLELFYTELTGVSLPLASIHALHQAGKDPAATATVRHLIRCFGQAISAVINVLDPDVIVIGGGVGQIPELYTEGVNELKHHIFNSGTVQTQFLRPALGDSAGVFGALELIRPVIMA